MTSGSPLTRSSIRIRSISKEQVQRQAQPDGYAQHLSRYLIAWGLCVTGDWLCGPGVYALYASYGFTPEQNARLFVTGFAASSILGCFAGRMSDTFGRKRAAMLMCVAGVVACALNHVRSLPVLYLARILDGLRYSLLSTVFESWLVSEHMQRFAFPPELLSRTFSLMYSISYFSAILCGITSQIGVQAVPQTRIGEVRVGRWGVPVELAALSQAIGFLFIAVKWGENYKMGQGEGVETCSLWESLKKPGVLMCGLMVSCFESCVFIFVFSWTPALTAGIAQSKVPIGLIFSVFMACCMAGARSFNWCLEAFAGRIKTNVILLVILASASFAMLVPAAFSVSERMAPFNFLAFMLFQFCTGAYFPAMGALKSECVDEGHRATIYNLFRTPMNCIVIAVILFTPSATVTFRLIFTLLSVATICLGLTNLKSYSLDNPKAEPLLQETWKALVV